MPSGQKVAHNLYIHIYIFCAIAFNFFIFFLQLCGIKYFYQIQNASSYVISSIVNTKCQVM